MPIVYDGGEIYSSDVEATAHWRPSKESFEMGEMPTTYELGPGDFMYVNDFRKENVTAISENQLDLLPIRTDDMYSIPHCTLCLVT